MRKLTKILSTEFIQNKYDSLPYWYTHVSRQSSHWFDNDHPWGVVADLFKLATEIMNEEI